MSTSFAATALIAAVFATSSIAHADNSLALDHRIAHLVCFKFKAPAKLADPLTGVTKTYTTVADVAAEVTSVYYGEAAQITYVSDFGGGANNSQEGFSLSYDRCYSMSFASEGDRDYFVGLDHTKPFDPHHDAFKNFVAPAIAGDPNATPAYGGGLFVFDYETLKP